MASKKEPKEDLGNIAEQRVPAGQTGAGPIGGRVDNMTRRSGREPQEGHFVTIDRTHKDVDTDSDEALLSPDVDGYGVFESVAEVGKDGYPETVNVRLRDDTAGALVTVPFDACRPAEAGRR